MLVLKRKRTQIIEIGNEIEIHVVEIKGSHVTLGIKAPDHVKVLRGELANETPTEFTNDFRQDWQA